MKYIYVNEIRATAHSKGRFSHLKYAILLLWCVLIYIAATNIVYQYKLNEILLINHEVSLGAVTRNKWVSSNNAELTILQSNNQSKDRIQTLQDIRMHNTLRFSKQSTSPPLHKTAILD